MDQGGMKRRTVERGVQKAQIRPYTQKFIVKNVVFKRFASVLYLSNTPILRQLMQELWNEIEHFEAFEVAIWWFEDTLLWLKKIAVG